MNTGNEYVEDFDPFEVRITRMFYSCSIDLTTNVPKLHFLKHNFGKSWFSCIKFFTRSRIFTIFSRPLWIAHIGPVIFNFFAVERFQWVWVSLLRSAFSFDPLKSLPEGGTFKIKRSGLKKIFEKRFCCWRCIRKVKKDLFKVI